MKMLGYRYCALGMSIAGALLTGCGGAQSPVGPPNIALQHESPMSGGVLKIAYSFVGPPSDGSYPNGGIIAVSGILYGATTYGGSKYVKCNGSVRCGTVYELTNGSSSDRVLHTFSGPPSDGESPTNMIFHDGVFYGATQFGGTDNFGTIFELKRSARHPKRRIESVIYNFKGPPSDGADVVGLLLTDSAGALYGLTFMGGSSTTCLFNTSGCGTIFRLTPPAPGKTNWTESILHSFTGVPDGAAPDGLVWDGSTIYGTTAYGGSSTQCPYLDGCGTLYTLKKSGGKGGWTETVVHSFNVGGSPKADGSLPGGALVAATNGTIYGTTQYGGGMGSCDVEKGLTGCGVLYAFAPPAHGRTSSNDTVLYAFKGAPSDGAQPDWFIVNGTHAFYGVTGSGGNGNCDAYLGCGTIYELKRPLGGKTPWKERVLHAFQGPPNDGYAPGGPLVLSNGVLSGETYFGGSGHCAYGCGVIYSLQL